MFELDLAFNYVKPKDWYFVLDLVQFRTGLGYRHSFMVSYRWGGGMSRRLCGGGPCDFGATPSPLTRIWTQTLDLGLTTMSCFTPCNSCLN